MFLSAVDEATIAKTQKLEEASSAIKRCIQFSGSPPCIERNPDDGYVDFIN